MNRELEIAVLMEDNCTKKEAEEHLKNGTTVYDEPLEYIDSLQNCKLLEDALEDAECATKQEYLDKIRKGEIPDISMVEYQGHEYLIEYCL